MKAFDLVGCFFIFDSDDNQYYQTILVRPINVTRLFGAESKYAQMVLGTLGAHWYWISSSPEHDYSR